MKRRLKRLTDLFQFGRTVHLGEDENGDPVVVWLQKLNASQRQECISDGQFASGKVQLGLTEESDKIALLRTQLATSSEEEKISFIIGPELPDAYRGAYDDVHAMEYWQENLHLIDRGPLTEDGEDLNEEETEEFARLNARYSSDLENALERRVDDVRQEWKGRPDDELDEAFLEAFRRSQGSEAFQEAFRWTQLYFSVRDCHAVSRENGRWDHEKCAHSRLFDSRQDVKDSLPQEVIDLLLREYEEIDALSESDVKD